MRSYPLRTDELIDDVLSEMDNVTAGVRKHFGGLAPEQLAWQPSPTGWGVGHCLLHLARTSETYREALEPVLDAGPAAGLDGTRRLRGRWVGRLLTRMVGPGGGMKVKAPALFQPPSDRRPEAGVELFLAEQTRLRELAEGARGVDLDGVRFTSPASRWVRLCVGDGLRVLAAHEQRHLAQAVRVTGQPDFPG